MVPHVINQDFIKPKLIRTIPRSFETYYLKIFLLKINPEITKLSINYFLPFSPLELIEVVLWPLLQKSAKLAPRALNIFWRWPQKSRKLDLGASTWAFSGLAPRTRQIGLRELRFEHVLALAPEVDTWVPRVPI